MVFKCNYLNVSLLYRSRSTEIEDMGTTEAMMTSIGDNFLRSGFIIPTPIQA